MNKIMFLHFILCLFTYPVITMADGSFQGTMNNTIAKPGCQTTCGNVSVPYPFGIGEDTNCAMENHFFLTCNSSKLFLQSSTIQVYDISESELRISTGVSYRCYKQSGDVDVEYNWWTTLPWTLTFSKKNIFTVIGCDDYALITGVDGGDFSSSCFGYCTQPSNIVSGECSGKGCCQTSITKGLQKYNFTLSTLRNHTDVWYDNNCGCSFLGEEGTFRFNGSSDLSDANKVIDRVRSSVPVVLDWVVAPNRSCSLGDTKCKGNSFCSDIDGGGYGGGYRCICNKGFEGNPYLNPGCKDIDECEDQIKYSCYGVCVNTLGSYNCTCPLGTTGEANRTNGCEPVAKGSKFSATLLIPIVMGSALLAMLFAITGICFGIKRRKLTRLREKFFEQNGGVLLKQKMNTQGSYEAMTLFTSEQLQKATDNYSPDKIVGRGGYGVVYKGVLPDKRVVAIKKSKLVDQSQAEQFINEVMILTQVIHRNVVKLLGCCLEEEVPVLVYEFVSNNTLFHHIHHKMSWLSWENRLRVATETASALAYLHSDTTMPIIHRDVKSSNILLDDNYTTKISDFGASRLVPLDHTQISTLIMGTLGYLDPEYFQTSQLTEKSDVYSFGVVLAELMTGKKPIGDGVTNEEKCLATLFVKAMKENRLFEIVEPRILREGALDKLQTVGGIVKRCLSIQGCERPTMREVAMELEGLRKFTTHPWVNNQEKSEDTRSLILEVEQSDLYEVPLVSLSTNEWESYSGSTDLGFQENKPR